MTLTHEILGARLQAARQRLCIPRSEAADKLGVSLQYLKEIETGVRQINSLELTQLTRFYCVKMGTLFEDA